MAVSKIKVLTAFEDCATNCKEFVLHENFYKDYGTDKVYMVIRECEKILFCKQIAEKVREEDGAK